MAECSTCGEPIPKDQRANKRMVHTSTSRQSLVAVFLMGRPYYQRNHFRVQRRRVRCDLRRAAEQAAVRRKAE